MSTFHHSITSLKCRHIFWGGLSECSGSCVSQSLSLKQRMAGLGIKVKRPKYSMGLIPVLTCLNPRKCVQCTLTHYMNLWSVTLYLYSRPFFALVSLLLSPDAIILWRVIHFKVYFGLETLLTCPKSYSGVSRKFAGGNESGLARLFCVPLACHTWSSFSPVQKKLRDCSGLGNFNARWKLRVIINPLKFRWSAVFSVVTQRKRSIAWRH